MTATLTPSGWRPPLIVCPDPCAPRGGRPIATPPGLTLRPLRADDEAAFVAGHRQMALENYPFGLGFEVGDDWHNYVALMNLWRHGEQLPNGWVPSTFLVADVGGTIVGRTCVRHELNDFLLREGGHIGYAVLPEHRRRGYATEILRQSLTLAHGLGLRRVLVTCDEDNVASAATIERCGGVLESVVDTQDGPPKRRYWITDSLPAQPPR